jgi:co-chaperonin GroES (HSP10)
MEIKMKNKNVLVKELQEEQVSPSGIILTTEKYNRKAIVIQSASNEVNVGDTIVKTIGKGTMFKINGEEYEILHEGHILAVIE